MWVNGKGAGRRPAVRTAEAKEPAGGGRYKGTDKNEVTR
jgi:hypothetical protein